LSVLVGSNVSEKKPSIDGPPMNSLNCGLHLMDEADFEQLIEGEGERLAF
jgi:hypothetical protein